MYWAAVGVRVDWTSKVGAAAIAIAGATQGMDVGVIVDDDNSDDGMFHNPSGPDHERFSSSGRAQGKATPRVLAVGLRVDVSGCDPVGE